MKPDRHEPQPGGFLLVGDLDRSQGGPHDLIGEFANMICGSWLTRTANERTFVITRPTEYEQLLAEHGTRGQAEFFLRTRGRDIAELEERHLRQNAAQDTVAAAIPREWRRTRATKI